MIFLAIRQQQKQRENILRLFFALSPIFNPVNHYQIKFW